MDELKADMLKQLEFVEWLKSQGIYNPMESFTTMERMFCVYKALNTRTPELPEKCTVEQYQQITGEKFPDDGAVHYRIGNEGFWGINIYSAAKEVSKKCRTQIYIVQTAQGMPGEGKE